MTERQETRWNGEPCQARRVTAIVTDDGTFPMYWAREFAGTRRPVVEVTYGGQTFYIDDWDGSGWAKVTTGGSPHHPHSSITIDASSIEPTAPVSGMEPSLRVGLRDEIVNALGRIKTTPPIAHRQEQADHVLAVLYREWPWLRAEAEDTVLTQAGLREQIAEAIGRVDLLVWPRAKRLEAADAVLSLILPATRITAALARDSEATVQRVITLHEQWLKAGPPPLGTSVSRWWDRRLAELHKALLNPTTEK